MIEKSNLELDSSLVEFFVFILDKKKFAIEIINFKNVTNINIITKLPKTKEYIEGITNVNGEIIPIINLRKKFNFIENNKENNKIVLINYCHYNLGLIIDDISKNIEVPKDILSDFVPTDKFFYEKYIKNSFDSIFIIDLEKLLI